MKEENAYTWLNGGYDHDENTWEPKSTAKDTIALDEFEKGLKG